MTLDIYRNGVPEINIPPFSSLSATQRKQEAQNIVNYVKEQAQEHGLDLQKDYRNGRGQYLRILLDRTGQQLHEMYAGSPTENTQRFQELTDSFDDITAMLGEGRLAQNNKRRKQRVQEYHKREKQATVSIQKIREIGTSLKEYMLPSSLRLRPI